MVDLGGLGGLAGAAAGVDVPGDLKLAYAVTDEVVVLGTSVDFVKAVLDAPTGANLASTDQFKNALARVDSVNTTLFWLDIAGVRGLAEPMLSGEDKAEYESDLKPYLEAFDSVIATSVAGDIDEGTLRPQRDRELAPAHDPTLAQRPPPREGGGEPGGATPDMAVRIRLTRVGATKQPSYRLVVADSRSARDGRAIDTIGHYNPRTDPIELSVDEAKAKDWLAKGAQPSDTVRRLFKQAGVIPGVSEVGERRWQPPISSNTSPSRSSTIPRPSRSRSSTARRAPSSSCTWPSPTWARSSGATGASRRRCARCSR